MEKFAKIAIYFALIILAEKSWASKKCEDSPCVCRSIEESLRSILLIPQNLSPLASSTRDAIVNLTYANNKELRPLITVASSFFMTYHTGFKPAHICPERVFENLICQSVRNRGPRLSNALRKAFREYARLCDISIRHSSLVSLQIAGCSKEPLSNEITPVDSTIRYSISEGLKVWGDAVPEPLRCQIVALSKSQLSYDRFLGAMLTALASPVQRGLVRKILEKSNYQKLLQWKGCNLKIDPRCCSYLSKVVYENNDKVWKQVQTFVGASC